MEKTRNYQLNQWAAGDKVQRVDFNADNAKIDAALRTNADAIAAEVTARTAAVSAEATAREKAVSAEVTARTAAVAALEDKTKLHTILTHYVRSSSAQQSIDLSSVRWSQWRQIYLLVQLSGAGVCECGFNSMKNFFSVTLDGEKYCIALTPLYDTSMKICGLLTGPRYELVKSSQTYGDIQSLLLYPPSGSSISSGTVTLKGVK